VGSPSASTTQKGFLLFRADKFLSTSAGYFITCSSTVAISPPFAVACTMSNRFRAESPVLLACGKTRLVEASLKSVPSEQAMAKRHSGGWAELFLRLG